jgi:hypothetical protein
VYIEQMILQSEVWKSKKQLSVCCEPVKPKYVMHSHKLQGPQETSDLYRVLTLQYNLCHAILLHDGSMYNSLHTVYQINWMCNPCTKCGQRGVVSSGASLLWSAKSTIWDCKWWNTPRLVKLKIHNICTD